MRNNFVLLGLALQASMAEELCFHTDEPVYGNMDSVTNVSMSDINLLTKTTLSDQITQNQRVNGAQLCSDSQ